jgi:hypothetical protein
MFSLDKYERNLTDNGGYRDLSANTDDGLPRLRVYGSERNAPSGLGVNLNQC